MNINNNDIYKMTYFIMFGIIESKIIVNNYIMNRFR